MKGGAISSLHMTPVRRAPPAARCNCPNAQQESEYEYTYYTGLSMWGAAARDPGGGPCSTPAS